MSKANTTSEDVKVSVASIYGSLLEKRKREKEEKEEAKRKAKEEAEANKADDKDDDNKVLTKKERRQKELDNWKTVVIGLTGDDLEYFDSKKKKNKKKYTKWIDTDLTGGSNVDKDKPKKSKPKNYNKEFAKELNMLQALVVDQNKFTNDLQKRYQTMVGPNTRDASPLNKTEVELAGIVNNARNNSLGFLREIGNIKKTIADLYMRQKKLNADLGGLTSNISETDLGLLGSGIAASLYGDSGSQYSNPAGPQVPFNGAPSAAPQQQYNSQPQSQYSNLNPSQQNNQVVSVAPGIQIEAFDPQSWDGGGLELDPQVQYESIPHDVVVEWDKNKDEARFKAIRRDNGEELIGCPVPTVDPSKLVFNEKDHTVRGQFDESYKLEILGEGE